MGDALTKEIVVNEELVEFLAVEIPGAGDALNKEIEENEELVESLAVEIPGAGDDLNKEIEENEELVESLSTYVANLARLPVGRFAEADAMNILNAVRSSESNSEKRLLLPGLLTMVDITLKENVFYVSGRPLTGEGRFVSREPSADGKLARLEGCFNRPVSIN